MDCRTFHRNLEDYLDDGFDFAGRFGMERHAQQCISCGKELADAQRLRRMITELAPVKAPPDFELSVINGIGKRKLDAGCSCIQRLWTYGIDWTTWRKLTLASSCMAVLALALFFSLRTEAPRNPDPVSPLVLEKQEAVTAKAMDEGNDGVYGTDHSPSGFPITGAPKIVHVPRPENSPELDYIPDREAGEAEYVEHLMVGSDGRPVTVQLPMPRKIRMQYGPMSEEYFIQNVSH